MTKGHAPKNANERVKIKSLSGSDTIIINDMSELWTNAATKAINDYLPKNSTNDSTLKSAIDNESLSKRLNLLTTEELDLAKAAIAAIDNEPQFKRLSKPLTIEKVDSTIVETPEDTSTSNHPLIGDGEDPKTDASDE